MPSVALAALVAAAYALGSVPFALVIARVRGEPDLRSRDAAGTSGAYRQYGLGAAALVFALDILKAVPPVIVARAHGLEPAALVAAAAVAGHCWPVWFGFRGGQGVAPLIGAAAVIAPLPAGLAVVLGFALMGVHRLLGLGARLAPVPFAAPAAFLAALGGAALWGGLGPVLALLAPMLVIAARGLQSILVPASR